MDPIVRRTTTLEQTAARMIHSIPIYTIHDSAPAHKPRPNICSSILPLSTVHIQVESVWVRHQHKAGLIIFDHGGIKISKK